MPAKGAYTITLNNREDAELMLWCLRYAVGIHFSQEEQERNIVTWYADRLEKSLVMRKEQEKRERMRHALTTARTLDEARAILDKPVLTDEEHQAKTDAMYQETLKQLEEQRLANIAKEQNTGESDEPTPD